MVGKSLGKQKKRPSSPFFIRYSFCGCRRKNMRRWPLLLVLCVFVLAACGDTPPTTGTNTAVAAVCAKANDGKRIAVDGYLRFPESFTGDSSVILRLFQTDAFKGDQIG